MAKKIPPKETCPFCGMGFLEKKTEQVDYAYKDAIVTLAQPGKYCTVCHEAVLDADDLKATRQALAAFKAEQEMLLPPEEIRRIRKDLHLTQTEAAIICGGGKNAFSRYESGEVLIPRAASNLLKVLSRDHSLLREILPL